MLWLAQNTAVTLKAGPLVSATDGASYCTTATLAATTAWISKNGAAMANKGENTALAKDTVGLYACLLSVADVNTVGRLQLWVSVSGYLPAWHEYLVVPTHTYNAIVAGSDTLQVHITEMTAGIITAGVIATDAITSATLAASAGNELGAAIWAVATRTLTASAISATIIDSGAITSAKFAASAITAGVVATAALAAGKFGAAALSATIFDTGALTSAKFAASAFTAGVFATDAITAATIAADAGTEIGTAVWATATRALTASAISAGIIDSGAITSAKFAANAITAGVVATDAIDADALAADAGTELGTAIWATATRALTAGAISATIIDSGAITSAKFAASAITAGVFATDAITTTTLAATVASEFADSVWDEARADHVSAGTFGLSVAKGITKNAAFSNLMFLMVSSTDHRTPTPLLTVTGYRSIDGAAFGSCATSIAEIGNGIYQYDAPAADVNGDMILFRFVASGADDTFVTVYTTS